MKSESDEVKVTMVEGEIADSLSLHSEYVDPILVHMLCAIYCSHAVIVIPVVNEAQLVVS